MCFIVVSKTILIAGGTGLIGNDLSSCFTTKGYTVKLLSRKPTDKLKQRYNWNIEQGTIDERALENVSAVINLAGANILGGKWTESRKKILRDSRIRSSRLLVNRLNEGNHQVEHFIQASAVGYFGDDGATEKYEDSPPGDDYMAQLCVDWEAQAHRIKEPVKSSVLRIGLYLSKEGGVYGTISKISRFYIASAFGNGKQLNNYTHRDEFCNLVHHIIEGNIEAGIYNAVGAEPFTFNRLVKAIANSVNAKVFLPNIPKFLVSLVLGEASAVLLNSHNVKSTKMGKLDLYQFKNLEDALENL